MSVAGDCSSGSNENLDHAELSPALTGPPVHDPEVIELGTPLELRSLGARRAAFGSDTWLLPLVRGVTKVLAVVEYNRGSSFGHFLYTVSLGLHSSEPSTLGNPGVSLEGAGLGTSCTSGWRPPGVRQPAGSPGTGGVRKGGAWLPTGLAFSTPLAVETGVGGCTVFAAQTRTFSCEKGYELAGAESVEPMCPLGGLGGPEQRCEFGGGLDATNECPWPGTVMQAPES